MTNRREVGHGENQRYTRLGCRCEACTEAHWRYQKRFRQGWVQKTIDSTGTRRRLQALTAMGWTQDQIAKEVGCSRAAINKLVKRTYRQVYSGTALRIQQAYDRISMTPGPSNISRAKARQFGYLPPLCWDDDTIDDPKAKPYRPPYRFVLDKEIDEVLVQRAMSGQPVKATKAERLEIIRRWQHAGRPTVELERILPTANVWRDKRESAA